MKSTTWLVVSAFLFGLLIGQPAISNASGVQSTGYTFCVNKKSGALRQLLKGSCTSKTENVLVMGAQGPAGPPGSNGLNGENGIGVGFEWVDQSGQSYSVLQATVIDRFPTLKFELTILLGLNGKTRLYSHFTDLPSYTTSHVWYSDSNCQIPALVQVNQDPERGVTFEEHRLILLNNSLPVFRTGGTFRFVTGLSELPIDISGAPNFYYLGWNSYEDDLFCTAPMAWNDLQNAQSRAYAITASELMPEIEFPITYRKVE